MRLVREDAYLQSEVGDIKERRSGLGGNWKITREVEGNRGPCITIMKLLREDEKAIKNETVIKIEFIKRDNIPNLPQ